VNFELTFQIVCLLFVGAAVAEDKPKAKRGLDLEYHAPIVAAPVASYHAPLAAEYHAPIIAQPIVHHAPIAKVISPAVATSFHTQTLHHAPLIHHEPVIAHAAPIVAHAAPIVAHSAPLISTYHHAPLVTEIHHRK
jgi:hypothetical protein